MSGDNDISKRLLRGDTYETAQVTVRRTFDFPIERKITVTIIILVLSVLIGPIFRLQDSFIRSTEPAIRSGDPLSLSLGLLALYGVGTAFLAGCLLLRNQYIIMNASLDEERARRLVRVEDLLVWFVLFGGIWVVLVLAAGILGLVSPTTIESLYASDIFIYRPTETITLGIRFVSVIGGICALVLIALRRAIPSREVQYQE